MLGKAIVLFALIFSTHSVHATLLMQDWQTPDDQALTFDDQTNLWWLDLTETMGMTHAQVTSEFSSGGQFEGWRYATQAEATDLYAQFGLTSGAEQGSMDDFFAAIDMHNTYLGDTLVDVVQTTEDGDFYYSGSWAITGTSWDDILYPEWRRMMLAYSITSDNGRGAELNLGVDFSADPTMSWPYAASLLVAENNPASVSPVPIPSMLPLYGLAVLGLTFLRRRKLNIDHK